MRYAKRNKRTGTLNYINYIAMIAITAYVKSKNVIACMSLQAAANEVSLRCCLNEVQITADVLRFFCRCFFRFFFPTRYNITRYNLSILDLIWKKDNSQSSLQFKFL